MRRRQPVARELALSCEFSVIRNGLTCQTDGLLGFCGYEIVATVDKPSLLDGADEFVQFIGDYVVAGNTIGAGETIQFGYWLAQAQMDDCQRLTCWELNADASEFVFGISTSVSYWLEQHQICQRVQAAFTPPQLDQMVVISDGVYEGDRVDGVRYPSPDHMSGWWLTTDRYNGDIGTLKTVHAHHLSAHRPDLIKFLALPFGYRFCSRQSDVWFDQQVAAAKG